MPCSAQLVVFLVATDPILCATLLVAMTLGAMCCGDNFCCALTATRSLTCWGGYSFTIPSGTYKAVACYGKAGVAVDDSDQIASCFGDSGYGVEGCSTGVAVQDVSCGFWGCCAVLPSGSVSCWGASTVYGANSRPTYSDCESRYGASSCSSVAIGLDSLKPAGTYTTVACGGKRAGHFCCVQGAGGSASCFGAGSSDYTPSSVPSTAFYQLSCGTDFCCGLTSAGAMQCWGNLNYDSGGGSDIPATLSGPYTQVACGNFAMYALDAAGAITAYGRIFSSSVGPIPAGTSTIGVPSATFGTLPTNGGFGHACAAYVQHDAAITTARAAACWGADYSNQVTNAPSSLVGRASTYLYPAALGDFCHPHPFLAFPCCPPPPKDCSLLPNHCPSRTTRICGISAPCLHIATARREAGGLGCSLARQRCSGHYAARHGDHHASSWACCLVTRVNTGLSAATAVASLSLKPATFFFFK